MRDRAIGIGLIALLAALLNPQNIGIIIMLGLIAILLDARWGPRPSESPPPAAEKKPSAKSAG